MKKIRKNIKVGTLVQLDQSGENYQIVSINETKTLFRVEELLGSFQAGHIIKFTNKNAKI